MTEATLDRLYDVSQDRESQRAALRSGSIPVAVYGLGKMGLPLASVYAERTGSVIGVDIDEDVVSSVNDGRCHVDGEPGLADLVAEQVSRERLEATSDGTEAARRASIHVVLVPTLVTATKQPDLSVLEDVIADVAVGLAPGDLVIIESTVPPRTARDVVAPTLVSRSGLDPGTFGVAVCPERTSSGTALRDIRGRYPKVVGGIDRESTRAAAVLYEEVTGGTVHVVSDATTAEAVKVFEGIYRDVNIALANELATTSGELGISVREAIATANELPVCDLHEPGPGVGGHCIPNYPHFLRHRTETPTPLTATARRVNERMPTFTVERLESGLDEAGIALEDATVAVLGLTYRPGVAELRTAPGLDVAIHLEARGATVYAIDPLVDAPAIESELEETRPSGHLEQASGPTAANSNSTTTVVELDALSSIDLDAIVLVTPHEQFASIEWDRLDPVYLLDGRDALELESTHHRYEVLGGSVGPTGSDGGTSEWWDVGRRSIADAETTEQITPSQE